MTNDLPVKAFCYNSRTPTTTIKESTWSLLQRESICLERNLHINLLSSYSIIRLPVINLIVRLYFFGVHSHDSSSRYGRVYERLQHSQLPAAFPLRWLHLFKRRLFTSPTRKAADFQFWDAHVPVNHHPKEEDRRRRTRKWLPWQWCQRTWFSKDHKKLHSIVRYTKPFGLSPNS